MIKNIEKMLSKCDYVISGEKYPKVMLKNKNPIGFLYEDFTYSLTSNNIGLENDLNNIFNFVIENKDLKNEEGEYILSNFQNVTLTSSLDYELKEPIYKVYDKNNRGEMHLIASFNNRMEAQNFYVQNSGLIQNNFIEDYDLNINEFNRNLKIEGFGLKQNFDEFNKKYDLVDENNQVQGYITKNNKLKILDIANKQNQLGIKNAYNKTIYPNREVKEQSFFITLKEALKQIMLILKEEITFNKTPFYEIYDLNNKKIALMSNDKELTFTDSDMEKVYKTEIEQAMEKANQYIKEEQQKENKVEFNQGEMEQIHIMFRENPDLFEKLDLELKDKLLKSRVQKSNPVTENQMFINDMDLFENNKAAIRVTPTRRAR